MAISRPTLYMVCLLLALGTLSDSSVNAQTYACSYVQRYENCQDIDETVCSVYPGVCVSESCQPQEYYNRCYACQDPMVMAYYVGACGSQNPYPNPDPPKNDTNTSNPGNPTNPTDPTGPTNPNNSTNSTNSTDPDPNPISDDTDPGEDGGDEEFTPEFELVHGGGSETLPIGADVTGIIGEDSDLEDTIDAENFLQVELEGDNQEPDYQSPNQNLRQSFFVVVYCDQDRPKSCRNDVNPVCALTCVSGQCQKTVDNICKACADTNVLSYSLGRCEVENIKCPTINFAKDYTTCTSFYDPVCSYPSGCTSKSCATTVTNSCGACYTNRASYFTLGPC